MKVKVFSIIFYFVFIFWVLSGIYLFTAELSLMHFCSEGNNSSELVKLFDSNSFNLTDKYCTSCSEKLNNENTGIQKYKYCSSCKLDDKLGKYCNTCGASLETIHTVPIKYTVYNSLEFIRCVHFANVIFCFILFVMVIYKFIRRLIKDVKDNYKEVFTLQ